MKTVVATLESMSPYGQSQRIRSEKKDKEPFWDLECRVWRDRIHATPDGRVFIPALAFKRSLEKAAGFLRLRIEGKGSSEYTKHFLAGVMVSEGLELPLKLEEVEYEDLFLSSRGQRGKADVLKRMPVVRQWEGEVTYYVLDDTIGKDVFYQVLQEAGNFIGIGRFRPENGGYYGRYKVIKLEWQE